MVEEKYAPWDLICRGAVRLGGLPRDQISSDYTHWSDQITVAVASQQNAVRD